MPWAADHAIYFDLNILGDDINALTAATSHRG